MVLVISIEIVHPVNDPSLVLRMESLRLANLYRRRDVVRTDIVPAGDLYCWTFRDLLTKQMYEHSLRSVYSDADNCSTVFLSRHTASVTMLLL